MNTRRSTALAALAMSLAFVAPLAAQDTDAAKEGQAAACPCSCMDMQAMHGNMMNADSAAAGATAMGGKQMGGKQMGGMKEMKGDSASAHAGMHAGMDPEAHAAMMKAHREAMASCDCAANAKGQTQAGMQGPGCPMNGPQGAEGMPGMKKMQGQGADTAEEPGDSGGR